MRILKATVLTAAFSISILSLLAEKSRGFPRMLDTSNKPRVVLEVRLVELGLQSFLVGNLRRVILDLGLGQAATEGLVASIAFGLKQEFAMLESSMKDGSPRNGGSESIRHPTGQDFECQGEFLKSD